jgi:hypothetical protein
VSQQQSGFRASLAQSHPVNPVLTTPLLSLASASPHSSFPLPLLPPPPFSRSTSRRVHQSRARARFITAIANDCVRALNTIHFNYPSPSYTRLHLSPPFTRSTGPSPAQRRLLASVFSAAAAYFSSCRRLRKQVTPGRSGYASVLAPRASLPALPSCGREADASLVISSPHHPPLLPASTSAAASGPVPGFDLAAAFRAFDSLPLRQDGSARLPSSYDSDTGIVPLVASRVALPDNLHHVSLLSSLPSDVASVYSSSSRLLLPADVAASRLAAAGLHKPRALASRREYVLLIQRMLGLGMLQLTDSPQCVNGVFGVPKGDEETRLILDARAANCFFVDSPHVSLPSPSHLAQLQVDSCSSFVVAKMDLSNFYHQLVLPDWIRPYFAMPALSVRELRFLSRSSTTPPAVRSSLQSLSPGSSLFPCCVTLPMGFSHSVFLAQCVHEHVVYSSAALSPCDNLLNLVSPKVDRPLHGLYIDDCVLVGPSVEVVSAQYRRVQAAYRSASLPVKQSKCTAATGSPVTVLGVEMHGDRGTISLSPDRHVKILSSTLRLLQQPLVSGRELARVLGAWAWQLLLRRPAFCAVKHCYRFVDRWMDRPARVLWPSAVRELKVLIGLSPLLFANLRAPWSPHLLASDASSHSAGVVTTRLGPAAMAQLWPLGAAHLPSLLPSSPSPPSSTALLTPPPQPSQRLAGTVGSLSQLTSVVEQAGWSTLISCPLRTADHINALELDAVSLALQWCSSRPATLGCRLPLLIDSAVGYYALRKGRSSSPDVLSRLRRCSALSLAMGCSLFPVWVPSALNPADAPSRSTTASASGESLPGIAAHA